MEIKSKAERLKEVVSYMKKHKIVKSQQELCSMLGYQNATTLSQFVNGHNPIPKGLVKKFQTILPELNEEWVETGKESMLGSDDTQHSEGNHSPNQLSHGNNSPNVNGSNNHVGSCASIDQPFEELAAFRRLVENAQEQITIALNQINDLINFNKEQFNRLMNLLEKQYEK